jgi:hypothetical protein
MATNIARDRTKAQPSSYFWSKRKMIPAPIRRLFSRLLRPLGNLVTKYSACTGRTESCLHFKINTAARDSREIGVDIEAHVVVSTIQFEL